MKIKSLLFAATAVVIGLSACSKEDGGKVGSGEKSIYIQFSDVNTRADMGQLEDGTNPVFASGHLYFTTANGDVKRYIRVTTQNLSGTLSPQALQNGTVIESLGEDVVRVHLYGNVLDSNQDPIESININNISEMTSIILTHESQRDAAYGVTNATLMGSGDIVEKAGSKNGITYKYEAKFKISPLLARIEIKALTANSTTHPTDPGPREFGLEGIFINNYHRAFTLGNLPTAAAVNNGSTILNYQEAPAGVYATADKYYLFDNGGLGTPITASSSNKTISPDKDAWAYNVFAATAEPHIVLHLKNVVYSDGTPYANQDPTALHPQDAYLTVTRFATANDEAVELEGGYIYRLTNLTFGDDDLTDTPEPNKKGNVYVEVDVMKWTVKEVVGKFD